MSDTIGRVTVPAPPDSGATFPLKPDFGCGMMRSWPVITHRFGDLATKATQRFQVGIGPRKFSFRKQSLSIRDRAALVEFFNAVQGSFKSFTYNVPNFDRGATTTPYTVIFDTAPLSIQDLATRCQVGIDFIEIPDPAAAPNYEIASTCTRFPSAELRAALLDQVQRMIPLVHIKVRESGVPDIYLSDRRCTVGGQLYLPRLLDLGEPGSDAIVTQDISGTVDDVSFVFGNADRVMRALSNDTDLYTAEIDLSLYHINTGILLELLWKGEIIDFTLDGSPQFTVRAGDPLHAQNRLYPKRAASRTCWKTFDDGLHCPYSTAGSGGDPTGCDYFFDSPNGCQSHGMDAYFGGHPAQPQGVQVKDNTTGTLGFGRNVVTATSIISDTMWNKILPKIWCNDDGDAGKCFMASGIVAGVRDEGDFFDSLVIVGAGKIGLYTGMQVYKNADGYRYIIAPTVDGFLPHGFKVDSQFVVTHDPQSGLREIQGADPATPSSDYFSLTQGAFGAGTARPPVAAGTAFMELRYAKPSGFQPSSADQHQAQIPISRGETGFVWDSDGSRSEVEGLTNPFWIAVNSYLEAKGLQDADSDTQLAAFMLPSLNDGAGNGTAEIADLTVTPLVGSGTETQFRFHGTLGTAKPFRDWLTEILAVGMGGFTWEGGKLKLFIRENASATSAFTLANILFQSLSLSPIKPAFEKLVIEYADRNYQFQTNTAEYYDKTHAAYYGNQNAPIEVQQHSVGCATLSQGLRMAAVRCREEIGGIDAKEWAAAKTAYWKTTILALETGAGQVVSVTHPDCPGGYSVDDWVVGGSVKNWQAGISHFRIQRWRLLKDWSIEIEGRTVTASMYDLEAGPKPKDVVALPLPALFFPIPQGEWAPYQVQARSDDPLFPNEWTFDVSIDYEALADKVWKVTATVKGKQPVDLFIPGCGAPIITSGSITQSDVGGSLPGGKTFRVSICATIDDGTPSPPSAVIIIQTAAGTDTHSFTINGVIWPDFAGLTGFSVFVSDVDDLICRQQTGVLVNTGSNLYTPDAITVAGPLERSTLALPNPDLDLLRLKQKFLIHGGVLGAPVDSVSGTQFVCGQAVDVAALDNWAGRYAIVIGRPEGSVPFMSFRITAFNPATGAFTSDQDVEAAGLLPGDVIVVTFLDYDNSADPTKLTDPGIKNALNFDILTEEPTPHSGLAIDQDRGAIVRGLYGPGRGNFARILSNTDIDLQLDRPFPILPGSIWIVESAPWDAFVDSTPIKNNNILAETTIPVPVNNYLKKSILGGGFTVNRKAVESGEADAPVRMLYVYGKAGFGVYDKATFNIQSDHLEVGTDVAFHYTIRNAGTPTADFPCDAKTKVAAVGADAKFDIKYTPPGDTVGGGSTVSVFSSGGTKITIPAGSTAIVEITDFDPAVTFEEGGILSCDVLQVGSTTPGAAATIVFKWRIN